MTKSRCFICQDTTNILDSHHILPQFAGGESGPTVDLCSSCHSGIHRQALNLISKSASRKAYFNDENMQRAKPLIEYIVMALIRAKEDKTTSRKAKVVIEINTDFLLILHSLKADAGHTNLSTFCANILRAYANSRI